MVLADVTLPDGRVADLSIRDGLVCHTGAPLPAEQIISCRGMTVLPGCVDMHVHCGAVSSGRRRTGRAEA